MKVLKKLNERFVCPECGSYVGKGVLAEIKKGTTMKLCENCAKARGLNVDTVATAYTYTPLETTYTPTPARSKNIFARFFDKVKSIFKRR